MPCTTDRLDHRILAMVQQNNLVPHRQIAEQVGLSTPAVTRRLKRLRAEGVIREDVSILEGSKLGRPLTIIVTVVVESELPEELDAMRHTFSHCPQIQHCHYVTGEPDFILIFNVSEMTEYEELTRVLFFKSGNVTNQRGQSHCSKSIQGETRPTGAPPSMNY